MKELNDAIALFETSGFFYLIATDMSGRYSYINPHYAKVFSYVSNEIVGMPYEITMHPEDTKICEQVAAQCFANSGQLFPATIRKHDGKGGFIITQWEYKAIFNDDGSPAGIYCIGYDITAFVSEQKALQLARTEISRTETVLRDIAFEQSHILRMPLANILGLCNILEKMEVDHNIKQIASMLMESASQLDNVVKNIVKKTSKGYYK